MDAYEFAMANGLAHVCKRGNCWSLCGWQTSGTIRGEAVPCQTCLQLAGEAIADREPVGSSN
jgi:hypothetical protein